MCAFLIFFTNFTSYGILRILKEIKMTKKKCLFATVGLLVTFILFTLMVKFIGVKAIGPEGSSVGLADINGAIHDFFGLNMTLYHLTNWAQTVFAIMGGTYAVLGVYQFIKTKSIKKVDGSLIALGIFYVTLFLAYLFFEIVIINYRPEIIKDKLSASYPSSTTMLSICFSISSIDMVIRYVKDKKLKYALNIATGVFCAFMVIGRFISGVHWFTDIMGGILLSGVLIAFYCLLQVLFENWAIVKEIKFDKDGKPIDECGEQSRENAVESADEKTAKTAAVEDAQSTDTQKTEETAENNEAAKE